METKAMAYFDSRPQRSVNASCPWRRDAERRLGELARDQRWGWALALAGHAAILAALAAGYLELDSAMDRRFDLLQDRLTALAGHLSSASITDRETP